MDLQQFVGEESGGNSEMHASLAQLEIDRIQTLHLVM
jgi:hypothetical protein